MPFNLLNWCELADSGQTIEVSEDGVQCALNIVVDGADYLDALEFILPTARVAIGSDNIDGSISRNRPVKFPGVGENLTAYASQIESEGYGTPTKRAAQEADKIPPYFEYEKYKLAVKFESIPYEVKTDAELAASSYEVGGQTYYQEWTRNCVWYFEPMAELLTLEGSQLQYVENPDGGPTVRGAVFPGVYAVIEQKAIITCVWKDVPADFVLLGSVPLAFFGALGRVNSETFLDYEPGTLGLFDNPEFIVKPIGVKPTLWVPVHPWLYDIKIKFRFFDPPKGNQGSAYRGHNLIPVRGQPYYLYATRVPFDVTPQPGNQDATRPPLFLGFDFARLFQYAPY